MIWVAANSVAIAKTWVASWMTANATSSVALMMAVAVTRSVVAHLSSRATWKLRHCQSLLSEVGASGSSLAVAGPVASLAANAVAIAKFWVASWVTADVISLVAKTMVRRVTRNVAAQAISACPSTGEWR